MSNTQSLDDIGPRGRSEKEFYARVWATLVLLVISGVPLASLLWGQALTPKKKR